MIIRRDNGWFFVTRDGVAGPFKDHTEAIIALNDQCENVRAERLKRMLDELERSGGNSG